MLPRTESEISAFLEVFETCTLPKQEWTHAAHLLTGACHVHAHGPETAIEKMRTNVRRFNESVGGKNTPTSSQPVDRSAFAHLAVEHFTPQRNIFAKHYNFDLLASSKA